MKRALSFLILALLLISIPISAAEPVKITHLTYFYHGDKNLNYLQTRAELFKKQYGIEVEIIVGNQEKFKTMLAGGVEPDVFDLPDFDYLANEGYYVDIKPLLQRDGLIKAFNPVLLSRMASANGAIYEVPQGIASVVGYFNRTMFLESGVQTPLQLGKDYDWNSVIKMGKKLTRDLNGDGIPETFGVDRAYAYWRRAVAQAGGEFYEYNSKGQPVKSLWNTAPVEQGLSFVANMWAEGIVPWQRVSVQDDYFFWKGKTGIDIVDSAGIIGTYLTSVGWDWDISLLPAGPIGPISSGSGGYGPNILASTKNLNAAWEWCKFLYINKQNLEDLMRTVGTIPAYSAVQGSYAQMLGIKDKNYQAIFETLNYLPAPAATTGVLPSELSPRNISVNDALLGTVPVKQFLDQLHNRLQATINDLLKASK